MDDHAAPLLERVFRAVEQRDIDAALAPMAVDIDLFDPHYPKPRMNGHEEVRAGLEWGMASMERFGFITRNSFLSADGMACAIEVDTRHRLKTGMELAFPQVFVAEARNGVLTRLHAYEPYGPNGIGGFFLGLARLKRRFTGAR